MRARLVAYAGTQLRDFLAGRALLLAVVTSVAAWGYVSATGIDRSALDAAGGVEARDQLRRLFESMLVVFAFAGGALAAQGLAARDRRRGFDRVLFARPMSPVRYYAQAFLVAGFGVVLLAGVAAELFAVAIQAVSVAGVMAYVALAWLTIGGLGFALAAVTRYHAVVLVLLVGGALLVNRYVSGSEATADTGRLGAAVQYLLPPVHIVAALRQPFARGVAVDPAVLAWPVGFGVVCVAAGMFALRRRPFAS